MNETHRILTEIVQLTTHIRTYYPELYKFLDENPITISSVAHPHVDTDAFRCYLEDLKMLLSHHSQTHKTPPNEKI